MVGNVRLHFGEVSFQVRLMLFWSGISYGKLILLKIIFKENFIYLRNVIWIYIYSGTPLARTPTGRHSIGRASGVGVATSHFIPKGFMYYGDHFISKILSLIESYLAVLHAAIAYRYCAIKSHNGKSRCRQYKFRKSLPYEFVTSHWH